MMDNEAPGIEPETESAGIGDILAGNQSAPAPQVEQPIAEAAPAPEAAAPEVKPETKPEAEQPFWYRKRLKEIEQRAKAAEQRAQQLEADRSAPQAQQPDFSSNPVAYIETQRVLDRVERSEDAFIDKHGEQEFESVKEWLATRPDIEAWAVQQRRPWASAHQQYQREKLSAEIGDNPDAWRQAERERLRAEILAEMPSATMAPPRPNIPAPASGQRSAAPRNSAGQFAGPTPLGDIIGKR